MQRDRHENRRASSPPGGWRAGAWIGVLAVVTVGVLLATAAAMWQPLLEWHYLRRLEEGTVAEQDAAARQLAAMGSREGIERILTQPVRKSTDLLCFLGKDPYVEALQEHEETVIPVVLESLHHEDVTVRIRSARVLQEIQVEGAARALIGALGPEDSRNAMLNALAAQDPSPGETIEALRDAMESESPGLRLGAIQAMPRIELEDGDLELARDLLERALGDDDPLARIYGGWSLGTIGPRPESIPRLVTALGDEIANVRRAAARALSLMGPQARPARAALERALGDPGSSDVRKYAAEALANIDPGEAAAGR